LSFLWRAEATPHNVRPHANEDEEQATDEHAASQIVLAVKGRREDLKLALEAVIAGKPVSESNTKPIGCFLPPPGKE